MATSRTGTAKWKKASAKALRTAQNRGQTQCPLCRTRLDWTRSRTPTSPEADHIIEHAAGGTDTQDNLRIICRQCNQQRGGRFGKQQQLKRQSKTVTQPRFTGSLNTSQPW